ncbi:hypothetical protein QBC36DRAFT_187635 [Triangularia setosa]|uniref:Rhodanese domain-containing protein n=1 Tax=Triangularia setosa TaxID=2587417 RepID=A0AAN6W717_9PEZI|nr:hypothetical protein QBC36DRAFT_187635 [Podospora setosa]
MGVHVHEHCLKMARREDGTPWWSAFPEPISSPVKIASSEVAQLLQGRDELKPHEFLLIDTRRTDCIGGTIQGSLNLPAHSFYLMRVMLYDLCKQAGIKRIIFYCGSSNGRGPRCAAWMQDYINSVSDGSGSDYESDTGCSAEMTMQVMAGGIRGWVKAHGGDMMEGYDEKIWQDPKPDEETR